MASVCIHLCVASELNKKLKVDNYDEFLLGSIAPDIAKVIGTSRDVAHFIDRKISSYPNALKFLDKYNLKNDFFLGYFVHLYTDYLWFKYFIGNIQYKGLITLLNGKKIDYDKDKFIKYLYNDYTNLNIRLLDEYDMDLSLFSNPICLPQVKMDEIPVERLPELLDASSVIIENSKEKTEYLFDIVAIKEFINFSVSILYNEIQKYMT